LRIQSFIALDELGVLLAGTAGMSVLRTVSLIAGGALVALGGSALALFI
jgi:hypothetical protein